MSKFWWVVLDFFCGCNATKSHMPSCVLSQAICHSIHQALKAQFFMISKLLSFLHFEILNWKSTTHNIAGWQSLSCVSSSKSDNGWPFWSVHTLSGFSSSLFPFNHLKPSVSCSVSQLTTLVRLCTGFVKSHPHDSKRVLTQKVAHWKWMLAESLLVWWVHGCSCCEHKGSPWCCPHQMGCTWCQVPWCRWQRHSTKIVLPTNQFGRSFHFSWKNCSSVHFSNCQNSKMIFSCDLISIQMKQLSFEKFSVMWIAFERSFQLQSFLKLEFLISAENRNNLDCSWDSDSQQCPQEILVCFCSVSHCVFCVTGNTGMHTRDSLIGIVGFPKQHWWIVRVWTVEESWKKCNNSALTFSTCLMADMNPLWQVDNPSLSPWVTQCRAFHANTAQKTGWTSLFAPITSCCVIFIGPGMSVSSSAFWHSATESILLAILSSHFPTTWLNIFSFLSWNFSVLFLQLSCLILSNVCFTFLCLVSCTLLFVRAHMFFCVFLPSHAGPVSSRPCHEASQSVMPLILQLLCNLSRFAPFGATNSTLLVFGVPQALFSLETSFFFRVSMESSSPFSLCTKGCIINPLLQTNVTSLPWSCQDAQPLHESIVPLHMNCWKNGLLTTVQSPVFQMAQEHPSIAKKTRQFQGWLFPVPLPLGVHTPSVFWG